MPKRTGIAQAMATTRQIFRCIIFCLGVCLLKVATHGSQQPAFAVATRVKPQGKQRCLTTGNVLKEWRTPPAEITIQIRDSASASEILEVLRRERDNEGLNLISLGAAWVGIARKHNTVSREVERDPMMREFVDMTVRLLRRSLFQDPSLQARPCANMFLAAGKLAEQRRIPQHLNRVLQDLNEGILATSYFMNDQEVANVIWSCSHLNLSTSALEKVMGPVTSRLLDVAEKLQPEGFCSILVAAAKLGRAAPELLSQMPLLAEVLPELISRMESRQVANSLWAIAKLPRDASTSLLPTIPDLVEQARRVRHRMDPQGVVNIFWATAVLKDIPRSLSDQMVDFVSDWTEHLIQSDDLTSKINEQGVANSLWAVQKLQKRIPRILDLIPPLAKRMKATIYRMIGEAVSSTLLAIGQLPERFEDLRCQVGALVNRMQSILKRATVRHVSNACWGMALCGYEDGRFMTDVTKKVIERGDRLRPKEVDFDLPQILAAMARLNLQGDPQFLAFAAEQLEPKLKKINNWGLCAVAWSYQQLDDGDKHTDFRNAVQRQVAARGFSPEEVVHSQLGPEKWYKRPRVSRALD